MADQPTINRKHLSAHLLHALTTISLLVSLSSLTPFLLRTLLNPPTPPHLIGTRAGDLGFVDECVSLVAALGWGVVSDRVGVRVVVGVGFVLVGVAFLGMGVAMREVWQAFLWRVVFALGGSACVAMITALLAQLSPTLHTKQRHGRQAGFIGFASGIGALMAVFIFLPLPALLETRTSLDAAGALRTTFQILAAYAVLLGALIVILLPPSPNTATPRLPLPSHLSSALLLPLHSRPIALGYLSSALARASSVLLSLFIPLWANRVAGEGREGYKLAAELSGVAQLLGLLLAPFVGVLTDHLGRESVTSLSAVIGALGCAVFALVANSNNTHPGPEVWVGAGLIGVGLIGVTTTSLGLCTHAREVEAYMRGAVAGVYSLSGGLAILILTKVGGVLFDRVGPAAPFWLMSGFNVVVAVFGVGVMYLNRWGAPLERSERRSEEAAVDEGVEGERRRLLDGDEEEVPGW
ncbi:MFS general substrate transporter [Saitoella complicata NRRL Y-17804]|uniref:Major facilitator superfamily (MFS) profile domain-containing protein n=1 Tax=Saitoella complicata (strain BCRC 22490 / CBS 7301 / JCM 7358 / NBRC 10748 / NRRL Y-17804) TaxID=698492 RepID=A0A0E9NJ05_SAICN|nr:MFS general substrate transporter [Saitoella complicata NRRL Y-17804]ODQ54895.1 MFS general substrate transporter [Saitoella complicata NRRL Y-17804]GAO49798.1 hypothetical protein G7K_3938-t1 [Saitoella complicata NRRL Y-17804]